MQIKINKLFNRFNNQSSKFAQILVSRFNIFKEFKIIDTYMSNSIWNPNFVCTNLKIYFHFYSIWFFIWKKFCVVYGLKNKLIVFWKLRDYFIFNKFKRSTVIYKNLYVPTLDFTLKMLQNLYLERLIHFFIEPLFDMSFKAFSFGYRPNHTIQLGLLFLIQKIKKYQLTWILLGDLDLFLKNLNVGVFMSLILKRIWDSFLLNLIKSWVSSYNYFFFCSTKKVPIIGLSSSSLLGTFLSNIYFDFFDNIFLTLLFIYKKKENLKISKFFVYSKLINVFIYAKKKYRYLFFPIFYFRLEFNLVCIKYIRIFNAVLFCTSSTFGFILWFKEKLINYLEFKIFLNIKYMENLKIKNVFQGLSFCGFCLKKHFLYLDIYIEKKKVIQYLKFKGFCNRVGFPIPCLKYLGWTQISINLRINFLIQLLNLWWFKGKNKKKMIRFLLYITRYSIGKLYANKYKKHSVAKVFNLGGENFNVGI